MTKNGWARPLREGEAIEAVAIIIRVVLFGIGLGTADGLPSEGRKGNEDVVCHLPVSNQPSKIDAASIKDKLTVANVPPFSILVRISRDGTKTQQPRPASYIYATCQSARTKIKPKLTRNEIGCAIKVNIRYAPQNLQVVGISYIKWRTELGLGGPAAENTIHLYRYRGTCLGGIRMQSWDGDDSAASGL
jgi:hypothetical protein